jgi:mRNA-degrading endonuclease RelE of RelBE toxin-antitoxin system
MAEVRFMKPATNFLKKLKDKQLKALYQEAIDRIREDHTVGEPKKGDLSGVYGYDIYYNKTNYELAYTVEYQAGKIIVVIMAGTRENFYEELKRYMAMYQ